MTFLPIVDRELRVAARRKSTYWTRQCAARLAFIVGLFLLLGADFDSAQARAGASYFHFLSALAFGFCLLAGIFFTADCLSLERREGTMGLLFLTSLRGYDVVVGKFTSASLSAFYGVLAIFPALALPLLMGGVTGGEFWRVALVLVTTLFLSLSIGLLASSVFNDQMQSMSVTLCVIGFMIAAGQFLSFGETNGRFHLIGDWLSLASPLNFFNLASDEEYTTSPERFELAWVSVSSAGVLAFGLACWILPRAWQEGTFFNRVSLPFLSRRGIGIKASSLQRAAALQENPIAWLVQRRLNPWLPALTMLGSSVLLTYERAIGNLDDEKAFCYVLLQAAILQLFLAAAATRFFAEARRSGALELLFSTPLSVEQVIAAHWAALWRVFRWSILILGLWPAGWMIWSLNVVYQDSGRFGMYIFVYYYAFRLLVDYFCTINVGMWMGLSCKRPGMAFPATVLYVLVLPWIPFCLPHLVITVPLVARAERRLVTLLRQHTNRENPFHTAHAEWRQACVETTATANTGT